MHLERIWIYPVKGCARLRLTEARVEPQGLANDRRWMLVDAQGRFLSQRRIRALAAVRVDITTEGLLVYAPGADCLTIDRPKSGAPRLKVTIWRSTVEAVRAGPAADRWFSQVTGHQCRLVFMDNLAARAVSDPAAPQQDAGLVSFADGYPLLLTSRQSLRSLNARMAHSLPMNRFRPNVVVSGARPFAEDTWHNIRIGAVPFRVAKPCARCVVTTVDQATLETGKEPLRTLATFRRRGTNVYFGENLLPLSLGTVRVGDAVEVTALRSAAQRIF